MFPSYLPRIVTLTSSVTSLCSPPVVQPSARSLVVTCASEILLWLEDTGESVTAVSRKGEVSSPVIPAIHGSTFCGLSAVNPYCCTTEESIQNLHGHHTDISRGIQFRFHQHARIFSEKGDSDVYHSVRKFTSLQEKKCYGLERKYCCTRERKYVIQKKSQYAVFSRLLNAQCKEFYCHKKKNIREFKIQRNI